MVGGPTEKVAARERAWTFAPTEGMRCADGSQTGFGFSPADSGDLVVYLQGGGACWDAEGCTGAFPRASALDGYDDSNFAAEANLSTIGWLSRAAADNPLKDANMVFVPYCTGDLHAGRAVATYGDDDVAVHHVGALNLDLVLTRARANLHDVRRVFLAGASGGAFGTWYAFDAVRTMFPDAEVHILADSGPPLDVGEPLWTRLRAAWGLEVPAACEPCAVRSSAILPFIAETSPRTRIGVLSFVDDPVLSLYLELGRDTFALRLDETLRVLDDMEGAAAFTVAGSSHVVLSNWWQTTEGASLPEFTQSIVDGTEALVSVGPRPDLSADR